MSLLNIFDYFFFRIYKFFKEKGDNVPETKGSLILSLAQFLALLDLILIGRILFDYPLPSTKYAFLPIIILIGGVNWYRYEKRIQPEQFINRWENEEKSRSNRNGLIIVVYLILSAAFPALYGMATNGQL